MPNILKAIIYLLLLSSFSEKLGASRLPRATPAQRQSKSMPATESKTFDRVLAIINIVIIAVGLYFAYDQAEKLTKSIDANNDAVYMTAWSSISTQTADIAKVFVASPEMSKYFYDNKSLNKEDKDYAKAAAIADLMLGYFDAVLSSNKYLEGKLPTDLVDEDLWKDYFVSVFRRSRFLCEFQAETKDDYSDYVTAVALRGCSAQMLRGPDNLPPAKATDATGLPPSSGRPVAK